MQSETYGFFGTYQAKNHRFHSNLSIVVKDMYKPSKLMKNLFIFVLISLMACSGEPEQQVPRGSDTILKSTIEASSTSLPSPITPEVGVSQNLVPTAVATDEEPIPTATILSAPTPTATMTIASTATPAPSLMLRRDCPIRSGEHDSALWTSGSLLFGTGAFWGGNSNDGDPYFPQSSGIWAISPNNKAPQLAYSIPKSEASWISMSNDGYILKRDDSEWLERSIENVILYDLRTQEERRIDVDVSSVVDYEWLPDSRFRYLINEERTWGVGIHREYLILNPETQQSVCPPAGI